MFVRLMRVVAFRRSPYLVLLHGISLLGILGLVTYQAAFELYMETVTLDVERVYIVSSNRTSYHTCFQTSNLYFL